ncbi:MAG: hypothetical protein JW774_12570 [Candidatus Aureabacteria bacterium]|nr:hypothetical protein [Candidatus Auribacterota bacterium]
MKHLNITIILLLFFAANAFGRPDHTLAPLSSASHDDASLAGRIKYYSLNENKDGDWRVRRQPVTDLADIILDGDIVVGVGDMAVAELHDGEAMSTVNLTFCSALIAKGKTKRKKNICILAHVYQAGGNKKKFKAQMDLARDILIEEDLTEIELHMDIGVLPEFVRNCLHELINDLLAVDIKVYYSNRDYFRYLINPETIGYVFLNSKRAEFLYHYLFGETIYGLHPPMRQYQWGESDLIKEKMVVDEIRGVFQTLLRVWSSFVLFVKSV